MVLLAGWSVSSGAYQTFPEIRGMGPLDVRAAATGCGEIILSGGGDICAGNCPDMPNVISFEVIGSDLPFEVDLEVSSSGFPAFPINGLQVVNGQVLNICLDGFFPAFDPATNTLTVPLLAIGLTATVTVLSATNASGCPVTVVPATIQITFIDAPTASAGPDQTICEGQQVTLSGSMGGSAATALWSSTGDGVFADPASLATTYTPGPGDLAAGMVVLALTTQDENQACIPAISSLQVVIDPSVQVEVATPVTICNTDEADLEAMVSGPVVDMIWITSGDGDFGDPADPVTTYQPGFFDILNGAVTLTYAPADPEQCTGEIQSVELMIVPAPVVNIPQGLELCSNETIDIEIGIAGDYQDVIWGTLGDGVLIVLNDEEVNYTPGPQDIDDQFVTLSVTVVSVFPACGQTTYLIPINVVDCDCPPLELIPPTGPLCGDADTLDLDDLILAGGSGTWSITATPAGTQPAQLMGSLLITADSDAGAYTVTYTLSFPEPGCPATIDEQVTVDSPQGHQPDLGPDLVLCTEDAIELNASFSSGPPPFFAWESPGDGTLELDPVFPTLSATYTPGPGDLVAGSATIVYTAFSPVCDPLTDTLVIQLLAAPFASLPDTVAVCNASDMGSVLNLTGLITAGDTTGFWTNVSGLPVDLTRSDSVDFAGVAPDFYRIAYTTAAGVSPCANVTYDLIVEVRECLCPLLVIQSPPGGICQDLAALPLDPFVMSGAPGMWSVIQAPAGSNPAVVLGSSLVVNGSDPGDYRLRFTLEGAPIDGCPDSAELSLFIQELPTLSVTGDTITCGQVPVIVSGQAGGSATGLTWSASGLGVYDNPTSSMALYTPALTDVAAAQVLLFAATTDTFGFCQAARDTIRVQIATPPSTRFSMLADTVCSDPDSLPVINLMALIVEGDGTGIWADPGGQVDVSDPTQVDFGGLAPGLYALTYTTQTAIPPCQDSVYTLRFVVENCGCPALELDTTPVFHCLDTSLLLRDFVLNADPGTWSVTDGPAGGIWPQVTGEVLGMVGASSGTYRLTYTLSDSTAGCPASAGVWLTLEDPPSWTLISAVCHADKTYYTVRINAGDAVLEADTGRVSTPAQGLFVIDSIPAGWPFTGILASSSGACQTGIMVAPPNCDCTLMIEDIADTITFCPGDTFVLIPFVTGAQGLPFATWLTPDGPKMRPTLPLYAEGQYVWIVRDEAGCEERDTFYGRFLGTREIRLDVRPPSCMGLTDGEVSINGLAGGEAPFSISVDGLPGQSVSMFPVTFSDLAAGSHIVTVVDANGCILDSTFLLTAPTSGIVDLGPDRLVELGDSTLVSPVLTDIVPAAWNWVPDAGYPAGGTFWVQPTADLALTLLVTDTAGCQYADTLRITIFEPERIYIPNIFSPNGDQINDVCLISTNTSAAVLRTLEIYDRWGGLLYRQEEGPVFSWDGLSGETPATPGVYVYKLVYTDALGNRQILHGDVTLIR